MNQMGYKYNPNDTKGFPQMPAGTKAPPPVTKKKYKRLHIEQQNEELFQGRPLYRIYNSKLQKQIGFISYDSKWGEYFFSSKEDCAFTKDFLRDVLDFMEKEIKK